MKCILSKPRIVSELAEQGLSIQELADRANMSRQQVYNILSKGSCRPATAGKLAHGIGVKVSEILKEEQE